MFLKKIDFTKKLKLIIDGQEMLFDSKITLEDHPSNFSSMTFTNVLPKIKQNYPDYLTYNDFAQVFSIGEFYCGDELIFFGVVNSSGRLSFNKNTIKSKAIKIVDFRKWLSIKKPVNLVFFRKNASYIVNELVKKLDENRIVVGNLDFTTDQIIEAYSITNKSPYAILKEVISQQTNSFLYFTITNDSKIAINYRSLKTFENMENEIDLEDLEEFSEKYKVTNIDLEFDNDSYINSIIIESANIISGNVTKENLKITAEKLRLSYVFGKLDLKDVDTKIYFVKNNEIKVFKKDLRIISSDNKEDYAQWDVAYKIGSDEIEINKDLMETFDDSQIYYLSISYFQLLKQTVERSNDLEILRLSTLTNTKGDVFRYDRYDDITSLKDLLNIADTEVSKNSKITRTLTIESDKPIFDVADVVFIKHQDSAIQDKYLVHNVYADIKVSYLDRETQNFALTSFRTILKSTANTNNWLNLFDNQSYRSNPVFDETVVIDLVKSDQGVTNIIYTGSHLPEKISWHPQFNLKLGTVIYGKSYFDQTKKYEEI